MLLYEKNSYQKNSRSNSRCRFSLSRLPWRLFYLVLTLILKILCLIHSEKTVAR